MFITKFQNSIYGIKNPTQSKKNNEIINVSSECSSQKGQLLKPNIDLVRFTGCIQKASNAAKSSIATPIIKTNEADNHVVLKLKELGLKFEENNKYSNLVNNIINSATSPDGNILSMSHIINEVGISYNKVNSFMENLETIGYAEKITEGRSSRWLINTRFHELVTGKKVLESGILIFDKGAISENELNAIIARKKLVKIEDGEKIRIQFDKEEWGNADPILAVLSSQNNPATLIIPQKYQKGSIIPDGIRVIFTDYTDKIANNKISPEFVCNSNIKLGSFHQLIIDKLLEKNTLTAREFCKKTGYSHQSQYLKYFNDLQKLGIINQNKKEYQLTPEFLEKTKTFKSSFDLITLHKN
jgi:predicted transcriptional regulator